MATRFRRRPWLAALVVAGALVFAAIVDRHYPIGSWLFFRYLRAIALAGLFAATCLIAGHFVLVRTLGRSLPLEEHLAVALPLGVFAFFLTSFGFGLLGLYGAPFFLLGPSLLIALGARRFLRSAERLRRHTARLDLRLRLEPLSGAILGFGCLGVLALWFNVLTPLNASYDARWYHLPMAENYLAMGGIRRFSEGWVLGAQPQLASLLYVWALAAPGALFDRVETAAHMELAIFLMTLLGIAAVVRRVLGERAPRSWVALFLFPGIFCYDSGLVLGADHVAALWAPPIFLLSMRYFEAPTRSCALLLAVVVAGALNTKSTAIILLPLTLTLVAARVVRDLKSPGTARRFAPVLLLATSLVVLTAPHWLKNFLFYGDPLFPLLRHWLPVRPWTEAAEAPYTTWFKLWNPSSVSLASVFEMVKTLVTFSFVPHDFPQYHGAVPVFGSLFTLCTPALPFLRNRRLFWLFGGAYLGIASWFWIHQQDRYLQVLVPWMAAGTAVVLIRLWREGGVLRPAIALLVGLQVVWGGDVPFMPAHRAAGGAVPKTVIDLLGRGYRKEYDRPLLAYPEWEAMSQALPRSAKVLVHEEEIRFGLGRASALDYSGDQGVFYWGEPGASTPAEVWKLLRAHGITHLLWADRLDHGTDTVAAGLVFFDFARHHTRRIGSFDGFALAALGDAAPAASGARSVAYYPCDATPPYAPGFYPLGAMTRSRGDRRTIAGAVSSVSLEQAMERADFLVYDARCRGPLPDGVRQNFELLAARGRSMLMARKAPP